MKKVITINLVKKDMWDFCQYTASTNWAEFKDPVSHMRLAGTVVASWSLT